MSGRLRRHAVGIRDNRSCWHRGHSSWFVADGTEADEQPPAQHQYGERACSQAEKRRVYVRHLAALTDLMTTSFKWHSAEKTGIEGEAKLAIALELGGKIAVARTTSFEVDLISTPEIRELAVSATNAIENYWPLGQGPHDFEKVRSQLIRAMRADLGEPPADGVT